MEQHQHQVSTLSHQTSLAAAIKHRGPLTTLKAPDASCCSRCSKKMTLEVLVGRNDGEAVTVKAPLSSTQAAVITREEGLSVLVDEGEVEAQAVAAAGITAAVAVVVVVATAEADVLVVAATATTLMSEVAATAVKFVVDAGVVAIVVVVVVGLVEKLTMEQHQHQVSPLSHQTSLAAAIKHRGPLTTLKAPDASHCSRCSKKMTLEVLVGRNDGEAVTAKAPLSSIQAAVITREEGLSVLVDVGEVEAQVVAAAAGITAAVAVVVVVATAAAEADAVLVVAATATTTLMSAVAATAVKFVVDAGVVAIVVVVVVVVGLVEKLTMEQHQHQVSPLSHQTSPTSAIKHRGPLTTLKAPDASCRSRCSKKMTLEVLAGRW